MKTQKNGLLGWIDARFPLTKLWNEHLARYYAPKNFNFWYYFGSLALLILVMQILTGIWLTMDYQPNPHLAFGSVEYIMRQVDWGWLIRYIHSTGASFFFIVVYLHMYRGLMYGSFKRPRELLWLIGMLIYLAMMVEAFMGYLLPWGQMSYWGAQVITSLFGAIPEVGNALVTWIRGDFVVSGATLNRFFALHVVAVPLALLGLVVAHVMALHEVGSNNPDGVEIKEHKDENGVPLDGVPFHPYYTVKDIMGVAAFLFIFALVVFYAPTFFGHFLEKENFFPADLAKTPQHIAPVWYFTPYYAILRAIPDKLTGVIAFASSVLVLFLVPWIDRHPVKSVRYRSFLYKLALGVFVVTFLALGYLGMQPPTPLAAEMGLRLGELYFSFFIILAFYSRERSAGAHYAMLVFIFVVLGVIDAIRYAPFKAGMMLDTAVLPVVYYLVFLLGPLFTRLNESKPVPQRVTSR